ncbi:hypothetical protein QAD02_006115 [Eretmocerus hayati]|uniref:Uncharacterized protein n=1 Tax=Eretmocerus hayati TaxID=131215 RepID=A0ACC2N0H4_9HYME|nr:hypothetical protein QAD02_006115 [Eretmocerus hayati]
MKFLDLPICISFLWTFGLAQYDGVQKLWDSLKRIGSHSEQDKTWSASELDVLLSSPELENILLFAVGVPERLTDLTLHLDQSLENARSNNDDNIIFSPIAIQNTLATILAASEGPTFEEIRKNLINDAKGISKVLPHLLSDLMREQDKILKAQYSLTRDVATGIFVQDDFPISEEFETVRKDFHEVDVTNMNFSQKSAQDRINAWAKDRVKFDISNTLLTSINSPHYHSPNIAMIFSSFHFEGQLSENFNTQKTRSYFKTDDGTMLLIDMLNKYGEFPIHHDDKLGLQIIGLPNEKLKVTMYVVLPDDTRTSGLRELKKHLTTGVLNNLIDRMEQTKVNVTIPKMDLSSTTSLKDALKTLGISALFDPSKADLSHLWSEGVSNLILSDSSTTSSTHHHKVSSSTSTESNESLPSSTESFQDNYEFRRNKASRDVSDEDKAQFLKSSTSRNTFQSYGDVGTIDYKDRSTQLTTSIPKKVAAPKSGIPRNIAVDPRKKVKEYFNFTTRGPFIVTPESNTQVSSDRGTVRFDNDVSSQTPFVTNLVTPSTTKSWTTPKPTTFTSRPHVSTNGYPKPTQTQILSKYVTPPTTRSWTTPKPTTTTNRPSVPTNGYPKPMQAQTVTKYATPSTTRSWTTKAPTPSTTHQPCSSTFGYPKSSEYPPFKSASAVPDYGISPGQGIRRDDLPLHKPPTIRRTLLGNRNSPESILPVPEDPQIDTEIDPRAGIGHTVSPNRRTKLGDRQTQSPPITVRPLVQVRPDVTRSLGYYTTARSSLNTPFYKTRSYYGSELPGDKCDYSAIQERAIQLDPYTWEDNYYKHIIIKYGGPGSYVCDYRRIPKLQMRSKRHVRDVSSIERDGSKNPKVPQNLYVSDFVHIVKFSVNGKVSDTEQASSQSPDKQESFNVDRPFLFFVRDETSKLIWLWASINNPKPFHFRGDR